MLRQPSAEPQANQHLEQAIAEQHHDPVIDGTRLQHQRGRRADDGRRELDAEQRPLLGRQRGTVPQAVDDQWLDCEPRKNACTEQQPAPFGTAHRGERRRACEVAGDGRQIERGRRVEHVAPALPQHPRMPQRKSQMPREACHGERRCESAGIREDGLHDQQRRHAEQRGCAARDGMLELVDDFGGIAQRVQHVCDQQAAPDERRKQQDRFTDGGAHMPHSRCDPP